MFVRHGESAGNADIPSYDLTRIPLTKKSQVQAKAVADDWKAKPSLIATSPYLRAQSIAGPAIERFIDVPVHMLRNEEFVYLDPSVLCGSTHAQRRSAVEDYRKRGDPNYASGVGARAFIVCCIAYERFFHWLSQLDDNALVYAFSHGQFMQAASLLIAEPEVGDIHLMRTFATLHDARPIAAVFGRQNNKLALRRANCLVVLAVGGCL
ncbi:histidine phosphatase family protein [Asticcacaulis sp. MM231]|uniref:phosphoglycerate mutase family protein n=1 Tax=Asticcacaulis sp. MM231 TaxID=3157666 RepID=UPI0032D586E3